MVITIGHSKGGVGKSTIAYNLAHSIKRAGKSVEIIDLDFQQTLFFVARLADIAEVEVQQPTGSAELISSLDGSGGNDTDYTIVDLGGFDNDMNRLAISMSDKLIVPIGNSVTDVIGFKTFEGVLDECVFEGETKLLLNNIHPLSKNFEDLKEATRTDLKNTQMLNTVVRNRRVYRDAMAAGKSVLSFTDKKAIAEIEGLKDELI